MLSGLGRRDEALTATQDAVGIRRRLAQDNPAAFEPDLATSLHSLAGKLSEQGRRKEALTATRAAGPRPARNRARIGGGSIVMMLVWTAISYKINPHSALPVLGLVLAAILFAGWIVGRGR
jgi:hypothetical protein